MEIYPSRDKRMYKCSRCNELKDWYRYRDGQKYWRYWCIRCEKSPVGKIPIREEPEHSVPH